MLLREAVSPVPDAVAARRVAIAMGAFTALVLAGGAYAAMRNHAAPIAQTPTIMIPNPSVTDVLTTRIEAVDPTFVKGELARYRYLFYSRWVTANDGRACPERLLEINRLDPALHAVDPWGTPYQFLCGSRYRPTFQMRSAGADRVFDTQDDVMP